MGPVTDNIIFIHFHYRNLYHVHWTTPLDSTLNSHSTCTAVAITFFWRVMHSFPTLQLTIIIFTTKLMSSLKNYSKNLLNYSFNSFGRLNLEKGFDKPLMTSIAPSQWPQPIFQNYCGREKCTKTSNFQINFRFYIVDQ